MHALAAEMQSLLNMCCGVLSCNVLQGVHEVHANRGCLLCWAGRHLQARQKGLG